jgi:hypothetical protein
LKAYLKPAALICIIILTALAVSGCLSCPTSTEAPAKDWLPVADAAMKKNGTDAFLIQVSGNSTGDGNKLPVNGKSHVWRYEFVSSDKKNVYDVFVRDGKLDSIQERPFKNIGVGGILFSYGDPRIEAWDKDSADAATVANNKLKEMAGKTLPDSAAYVLEISAVSEYRGKPIWTVYYYDPNSTVVAVIGVDPRTGKISDAWMP